MKLPGNRIVKTALAVFLTAYICQLIGWPPVFAVITAIVTLEPTVSDSIKKGLVRFPASAIGSFYAVLFIALFGNSPITYTLAASLTIITCYRLKLHAGLLVATITAVAMIEVVYDNYFMSFFIRLGTTSIGITVSTLVNLLILPPNFMNEINRNVQKIYKEMGQTLSYLLSEKNSEFDISLETVEGNIQKTEELVRYQKSEAQFHRPVDNKKVDLQHAQLEIKQLRLVQYHLNNLRGIQISATTFKDQDKQFVFQAVEDLANFMIGKGAAPPPGHEQKLRYLMELYWNSSHMPRKKEITELPNELILLYELISIFYLVTNTKE